MMEDRSEERRRQIEVYRSLMQRGPSVSNAIRYLRQIMNAEAELQRISKTEPPFAIKDRARDPLRRDG